MARGLHGTTSPSRFHHATREAEPERSGVRGRACRCDRAHPLSLHHLPLRRRRRRLLLLITRARLRSDELIKQSQSPHRLTPTDPQERVLLDSWLNRVVDSIRDGFPAARLPGLARLPHSLLLPRLCRRRWHHLHFHQSVHGHGVAWCAVGRRHAAAGDHRLRPRAWGVALAVRAVKWSGRFWARSGCDFDSSGKGSCVTGDCGSGQVECRGAGASPPATLAEFTLNGDNGKDFYDVSLVDGYNLPMLVQAAVADCPDTGCLVDLNERCPSELRAGDGRACRSACEAFGRPEYCCNGAYGNPDACHPSPYSQLFKSACPKSYSYAYDDATSTFTCNHTD
ncbi:hypothetical protein GUJ93_ZPchr0008g13943 [Zizania palustris]|uniref:Thaumatin-like protein n=1 Tax=Zizania palustris TaxID=103762 RepID=A0A8J5R7L4_ZIZPA|nr:hypothetical protein GUJ93_ZPchr0008g13943 [Zizania palustris]